MKHKASSDRSKAIWLIGAPAVGLILLFLAWFLLPLEEWLKAIEDWATQLGPIGTVLVSAGYVVATMLLVPGFPMTLAAAVGFGWWALAICFIGGMVAAVASFLISRSLARDLVKRLLKRHPKLRAMDGVARDETFKSVLLARLNPVTPFAIENYAFGLTGVRFRPYLLATGLGIIPGTILNVWIGVMGRRAAQGAELINWIFLAVGLLAAIGLSFWMTHEAKQRLDQQNANGESNN